MDHTVNETLAYVIMLSCDIRKGDIPAAILAVLIELGFQSHMDGFWILRKAIQIKYENQELRMSMVFEEIVSSSGFGMSSNQLEQAAFSAIDSAWKNRDAEKWDYFFSEERLGKQRKPTNKEFISHMACFMELWNSHCQEVCYEK